MKKYVLPVFVLVLAISLAACRSNKPMDSETPTNTQPTNNTTAATTPTVLPNPTIESNIPDPSVDTSMPMGEDNINGGSSLNSDNNQIVG